MAFGLSRTHVARNVPGASSESLDLLEHHRAFFGPEEPLAPEAFITGPVGSWSRRTWREVLGRVTCESEEAIIAYCSGTYQLSSKGNLERRRLTEVGSWRHMVTPTTWVVG